MEQPSKSHLLQLPRKFEFHRLVMMTTALDKAELRFSFFLLFLIQLAYTMTGKTLSCANNYDTLYEFLFSFLIA